MGHFARKKIEFEGCNYCEITRLKVPMENPTKQMQKPAKTGPSYKEWKERALTNERELKELKAKYMELENQLLKLQLGQKQVEAKQSSNTGLKKCTHSSKCESVKIGNKGGKYWYYCAEHAAEAAKAVEENK
jgi:hypothetical protein